MPNRLKSFQDWCVDTLCSILVAKKDYRGSLEDQGYKYVLKAIVDHFASMYYCGAGNVSTINKKKEHINLWWDHLNERTRSSFFTSLLMSENAAQYCLDANRRHQTFGGHGGLLHLEHITPKGYIYEKLQCLENPTRETVAECFKHAKMVLLTKEESGKYLDGKGAVFSAEDVNMLRKTFHVCEQEIKEAEDLIGKSPKSDGSGLLRMTHLYNSGVKFRNFEGDPMPPERWLTYLDDYNNEMTI